MKHSFPGRNRVVRRSTPRSRCFGSRQWSRRRAALWALELRRSASVRSKVPPRWRQSKYMTTGMAVSNGRFAPSPTSAESSLFPRLRTKGRPLCSQKQIPLYNQLHILPEIFIENLCQPRFCAASPQKSPKNLEDFCGESAQNRGRTQGSKRSLG